MSSHAYQRPTVSSLGRVVVLLVALAGLFAMHGLSDHGMAGPSEVADTTGMHSAQSTLMHADAAAMSEPAMQHGSAPGPHGGHDMDMAGMCLAVLAAVMLFGLLLWRRSSVDPGTWLPRLPAGLVRAVRVRVPEPPDLFALSIQRC